MPKPDVQRLDRALRVALKTHLTRYGYLFGKSSETVHRELSRVYGKQRYEEHLDLADAMIAGYAPARRVYERPRTLQEAGVLVSFQADLALATNAAMLEIATPWLSTATRVTELGCWTGGVTTFVGQRYAGAQVIGIEALPSLVRIAEDASALENVQFRCWDYTEAAPSDLQAADLLLSALGIDFAQRVPPLEGETLAEAQVGSAYRTRVTESSTYWQAWTGAATANATAVTVLRIASAPHLLAFAEGAALSGWHADFGASKLVTIRPERFPVLVWHRNPVANVSTEDVIAYWNDGAVILA